MSSTSLTISLLILCLSFIMPCLSIIGGFQFTTENPFFVHIIKNGWFCGGSIVAPHAVLTAAHCLFLREAKRWASRNEIIVVKSNFTEEGWPGTSTSYPCEGYIYHHLYNPVINNGVGPYDIALIKVAMNFDLSRPENGIIKPCDDLMDPPEGLAVGLGSTNMDTSNRADVLMGIRLYRYRDCHKNMIFTNAKINEETQICYGSQRQNDLAGLCKGDSGGPLVRTEVFSTNAICLIGLNSFGSTCSNARSPSVFTKAPHFANWIENNILALAYIAR